MYVRKVRNQEKVGRIVLTAFQVEMVKKMGIPLETYVKNYLAIIAKQRRWKWFFKKESK